MRGEPFLVSDFRGGVNLAAAPYALAPNQARDVLNVNSNVIGSLTKRNGFESIGTPTEPVKSLFPYHGSTDYLIGVGDDGVTTDIYRISLGGTVTSIKGAATVTAGAPWSGVQAPDQGGEGPFYLMNGVDTPLQWTGAGDVAAWTASGGTLPNGKFIKYFDNRIFIAGNSSEPSRLYASAVGEPRNFDTTADASYFVTFDPDDGEVITGIGTVGPYLLVFKPTKTYVVIDTDTGAYRRISNDMGCVSERSIAETENGTIFLSTNGTILVTDGSSVSAISTNALEPLLQDMNPGTVSYSAAIHIAGKYFISIDSSGSGNDTVLEYDLTFDSWWVHKIQVDEDTTTGVWDWAIMNPDEEARLYSATGDGKIHEAFKENVYTDNELAFESYWITEWHVFGMPHVRKTLRQVRADCKGSCMMQMAKSFATTHEDLSAVMWETAVEDSGSFGGGGVFGGDGGFGGLEPIIEHRYYTPGTARSFSFKIVSTSSSVWELFSYSLMADMRSD